MKNSSIKDGYTHSVLDRIDPTIRSSFSPVQISAIKEAVQSQKTSKGHIINERLSIPLFFATYYIVIFGGRDKRRTVKRVEFEHRQKLISASFLLFLFILVIPILVFGFLLLYFIKTAIGIDIFANYHLRDFLTF